MSAATSRGRAGAKEGPALDRKKLWRDIDRDLKGKDRAKLANLRTRLREARTAHQAALDAASARCREHRLAVRAKLQAERAQTLAKLRAKGEAERAEARGSCALDKGKSQAGTRSAREEARAKLAKERTDQEDLKRIARGNRAVGRGSKSTRASAAERRSESDDEVRSNIPPELVGLFERVKRSIKAGPRESRSEAFLRYAEEHPSEYLEAMEDSTEALIRDLERQEEAALKRRHARNPAPAAPSSSTRKLRAADPRTPSVELGELISFVYRTSGGEHVHVFRKVRPRLAYNAGGLLVAGGKYRAGGRGIVG